MLVKEGRRVRKISISQVRMRVGKKNSVKQKRKISYLIEFVIHISWPLFLPPSYISRFHAQPFLEYYLQLQAGTGLLFSTCSIVFLRFALQVHRLLYLFGQTKGMCHSFFFGAPEKHRERRELLHTGLLTNYLHTQSWVRLKPGARTST